ncbi:MAG: DUF393 domain-containing protein [Acidobacteria bacterium]|nr:DUF393 domain-containing protein [Acidobacteriota bacterium]
MRVTSPSQFVFFRILTSVWMMVVFVSMALAEELRVPYGSFAVFDAFPGMFHFTKWIQTDVLMRVFLGFFGSLGCLVALGWARRPVSFLLWYAWIGTLLVSESTRDVSAYFGEWLLLVCVVTPSGEPAMFGGNRQHRFWRPMALICHASWYLCVITVVLTAIHRVSQTGMDVVFVVLFGLSSLGLLTTLPRYRHVGWWILVMGICVMDWTVGTPVPVVPYLLCAVLAFDRRWYRGKQGVLYFDGVCGLCNGFVDYLMSEDDAANLRFAAIQSESAREHLESSLIDNLDTVIFQQQGQTYLRSDAALRATASLGGPFVFLYGLLLVPRTIRDMAYDALARSRYRFFGKRETCRLPSADERDRFLD